MANRGVDGDLILIGTGPVDGFIFEVFEAGLFGERLLGTGVTNASGSCQVRYKSSVLPRTLIIRLFDWVHRQIAESAALTNITDEIHYFTFLLPPADAHGWLVTMDTGAAQWLSTDNRITLFTDNHGAWKQLVADAAAAATSVHVSQLQYEIDYAFMEFVPDPPAIGVPTTGVRLESKLTAAAGAGADVQVLMNDFIGIGWPADTSADVRDYFAGTAVQVKGFRRVLYRGPMHAKLAVIDKKRAYTIGSPFIQEYFDDHDHRIDDPRRGEMGFLFNPFRIPIHDVSARIAGAAASDLDIVFTRLWDPSAAAPPPTPAAPAGADAVQITVTLPGDALPEFSNGATGILESYQRAIRYAEDFLYFENQYFTEDAIVESLIRAIRQKPALQLIMALNPKVDLPGYGKPFLTLGPWQTRAIDRLLSSLTPAERARVGLFTFWTQEQSVGTSRLIRNYIHSKVGIADDAWATVGSANLDGVSLLTSQYIVDKRGPRKLMRAIEVNAVVYNGVGDQPPSFIPDELRRTLWAEHLGYASATHADLVNRPPAGWLSLWRGVASRRLAALNTTPPGADPARILEGPFGKPMVPRGKLNEEQLFLKRIGVDVSRHKVETEIRSFNFGTGQWM